jgi:CHAD domain-containing protein
MTALEETDPLSRYLREQAGAALAGLPALPDEDAVHRTRVALRRLRTTVRVFAPLLEPTPAERQRIDDELRWLAGLLGDVRDRNVQRDRFASALDALPPEHVLGPVRARIDDTLSVEQHGAERALTEALGSERYRSLMALLERWQLSPPVRGGGSDDAGQDADQGADRGTDQNTDQAVPTAAAKAAEKTSEKTVKKAVKKAVKKVAKKAERRLAEACADGSDAELHRARKAAKRARYAAEVLAPAGSGKKGRKRFKRVQGVLGEHQDAVVAQATLRRIVSGIPAGESGFTLGLLHERERQRAEELRRHACELAAR